MALELQLIELLIVEGAECWGQSTKGTNKLQLRGDVINDQTKTDLLRKFQSVLGFSLYLSEVIAGCVKIGDQVVTAICAKCQIARSTGSFERAADHISSRSDLFRPWYTKFPEVPVM